MNLLPDRVVLVALVLLGGGCGRDYGGDPHAAQTALVPPDRGYRLWYLAPPWEVISSVALHATLRANGGITAGVDSGTSPPLNVVALAVDERRAGTDPPSITVADAVAAALAGGATLRIATRPVAFALGTNGYEGATFGAGLTTRIVAGTLGDGRTVVLTFTSVNAIESSVDIDDMIAAFEPRSPSP